MITFLLAGLLVAVAAALLVEKRTGARVVVTTIRGESIRGVQRFAIGKTILTDAEALRGETTTALAGRVEFPRRSVAMIQRLPEPVSRSSPMGTLQRGRRPRGEHPRVASARVAPRPPPADSLGGEQ